mmetsp:Transcript_22074/g.40226  ORF Transcript_22074/g.40226 Transcript_22074/m.40226 type:complete len:509 (-) Transcript_22074:1288-2814(-)
MDSPSPIRFQIPEADSTKVNSSILEPESVRLQREIDTFITQLEKERRLGISLDEQIKALKYQLASENKKVQSKVAIMSRERKLLNKIAKLERKLELTVFSTNDMQAKNHSVRRKIDDFRREKYHYQTIIENLSGEIGDFSKKTHDANKQAMKSAQEEERHINLIRSIRSKSASEKVHFSSRYSELHAHILEDRQNKQASIRKLEDGMKLLSKQNVDPLEHFKILNRLSLRWSSKVRAEKRNIDSYTKKLRLYEEAVAQIKAATGIETIEDMVTTFLKSEEQQVNVTSYLNNLVAQIEMLEEKNRQTMEIINRHKLVKSDDNKRIDLELQTLKDSIQLNTHSVVQGSKHQKELDAGLNACVKSMKAIIELFQQTEFELKVAVPEHVNELTELNSSNFTIFLGQIEEYLTCLKTFIGYANKSPSPELRALNLETIPKKNLTRKAVSIRELVNPAQLIESFDTDDNAKAQPLRLRELRARAKSRVDSIVSTKHHLAGSKSPSQAMSRSFFL